MEAINMKCSLEALVQSGRLQVASDTGKDMFDRVKHITLPFKTEMKLGETVKAIGVTDEFRKVINLFQVSAGETPAGFRHEYVYGADGSMRINLVRDISFGANGSGRPTNVLFSANTANPFSVYTMRNFIANLTTNPQIIYDSFLNNLAMSNNS